MRYLYKHSCLAVNKQSGLKTYKLTCRLLNMDMADRLKQRRKQIGLTQVQLAEKAGVTQQLVQQLEARKVLTTGKLLALSVALKVRPQWLESGEAPMLSSEITPEDREIFEEIDSFPPEERAFVRMAIKAMLPALRAQMRGRSQLNGKSSNLSTVS